MANGNSLNGKGKWAMVPIGVAFIVIAAASGYGKLQGHIDSELNSVAVDLAAIKEILPEIRDRLVTIETDLKWIKKGLEQ